MLLHVLPSFSQVLVLDFCCTSIRNLRQLVHEFTRVHSNENIVTSIPSAPNMVALTVARIFSCVLIVGILSTVCNNTCKRNSSNLKTPASTTMQTISANKIQHIRISQVNEQRGHNRAAQAQQVLATTCISEVCVPSQLVTEYRGVPLLFSAFVSASVFQPISIGVLIAMREFHTLAAQEITVMIC